MTWHFLNWSRLLTGRGNLGNGIHAHALPATRVRLKLHAAFHDRKDGEVSAEPHILSGMNAGAALADDDVAGDHVLAIILLDPQHLRLAVPAVPRAAHTLFVSHRTLLSL